MNSFAFIGDDSLKSNYTLISDRVVLNNGMAIMIFEIRMNT